MQILKNPSKTTSGYKAPPSTTPPPLIMRKIILQIVKRVEKKININTIGKTEIESKAICESKGGRQNTSESGGVVDASCCKTNMFT